MTTGSRLAEVLKLIQETGDRCIILEEGHEPYVVMGLASYKELLSTAAKKQDLSQYTERELLDHINQQIAEWRELKYEEADDYDLAQFRVEPPKSQTLESEPEKAPEVRAPRPGNPSPNLPVIEDEKDELEEYRLEPLG